MTGKLVQLPLKIDDEFVRVPSGAEISLRRPDFLLCKSREDFLELRCALMEKIIDIELQIDLFNSGAGVEQGKAYERDWFPRANAALKWAKLYRDECQQRQGIFTDKEKAFRNSSADRAFIAAAKDYLDENDFKAICDLALRKQEPIREGGE